LCHNLDISKKILVKSRKKTSKKRYNITFEKGYAKYPPFEAETLDVAVTVTYCGLPHLYATAKNWKKVLKKGGMLIVIDGLYNGGLIERKTRQFISDFLTLFIERRYPRRRQYSKKSKMNSQTPIEFRRKKYLNTSGRQGSKT